MNKSHSSLVVAAACLGLCSVSLRAQVIPVPLDYNYNGIVHAGESGNPDDPNGFRSISDRALDFSAGVPVDPLLNSFQLITTPATLDIVHLGNRNTVAGGGRMFDTTVDGDEYGIVPSWLPNVDQSGPQTTTLVNLLPITDTTIASFLFQISNGGGSFDVRFDFVGGNSFTATLSGGDWFGGPYPGTDTVDQGFSGNNLSLVEGRIDMTAFEGEAVQSITFENGSNPNAGIAILGCNFEYPPKPSRVNQVPLAYNFNGIVHVGESGLPDDPNGYRSISDRGLDFQAGVPADPIFDGYLIVDQAGALDIVHLGNRNTVGGSSRPFDPTPDGDDYGIQPNWLANVDQTGPQATVLAEPVILDATSEASVLFQITNGGGAFDIEFQFATGAPVVATVSGPDWFGGVLPATANFDSGLPGPNLTVTERTVDLSAEAGRTLTGVAFQNRSNTNGGYGILAMNVVGCVSCTGGASAQFNNYGGGTSGTIAPNTMGHLGCDLEWLANNQTPGALGVFAVGVGNTSVPLSVALPGCPGTIHTPNPVLIGAPVDALGSAKLTIEMPVNQALCGAEFTAQYAELAAGPCFLVLGDALGITIGN